MIAFNIPGLGEYAIEHLVMDVNGTIAVDGRLIDGVAEKIELLSKKMTVHLLTADTHGKQAEIDRQLNLTASRIKAGEEALQKAAFVQSLGSDRVVAVGQGANDAEMLKTAKIGICVMSVEGVAKDTLLAADFIMPTILAALESLENPGRIIATLRR